MPEGWRPVPWTVVARLGAVVATLAVVAWAAGSGSALVHAHPLYPALLVATVLSTLGLAVRAARGTVARSREPGVDDVGGTPPAARPSVVRRAGRAVAVVAGVAWLGVLVWLRPLGATEPALAALDPGAGVAVTETATAIELRPDGRAAPTAVLFQPGAKVDARAYAAVLRPLAEEGFLVVIPKQPLGIAFLATSAFETARSAHPEVAAWVVGGHSLGGTVAAMDAEAHDADPTGPVRGLLLYASYPATDLSASLDAAVLSVSGSEDGLATPESVDDSRAQLPASARFVEVEGASHASFGDYGPQSGDGVPTLSADEAREQISGLTVDLVTGLDAAQAR